MNVITRNNVKIIGRGKKVMIFAHGYGCSQRMWRLITPSFEEDYRIVLFDHVGSGDSDLSRYDRTRYSSLDGYAQDIIEICKELELSQCIFVGHSVSSIIGILASIHDPSVFEKLILIGPSPSYINDGEYYGGFTREAIENMILNLQSNFNDRAKTIAPVIMGNLDRHELSGELMESFCRTKPDIAKHFAEVTFLSDNRKDLVKVTLPSLIIQSTDDAIAPIDVGNYVHQHLANSKLTILNAKGHCPHLSVPQETIQAIKAYLK